jgi:hypothetical protein
VFIRTHDGWHIGRKNPHLEDTVMKILVQCPFNSSSVTSLSAVDSMQSMLQNFNLLVQNFAAELVYLSYNRRTLLHLNVRLDEKLTRMEVAVSRAVIVSVGGVRPRCSHFLYDGVGIGNAMREFGSLATVVLFGAADSIGHELAQRCSDVPCDYSAIVCWVACDGEESYGLSARKLAKRKSSVSTDWQLP